MVCTILIVTGLTSSVMMVAIKYKLDRSYELKRADWMPQVCYFCISFWISLLFMLLINWKFQIEIRWWNTVIPALASAPFVVKILSSVLL